MHLYCNIHMYVYINYMSFKFSFMCNTFSAGLGRARALVKKFRVRQGLSKNSLFSCRPEPQNTDSRQPLSRSLRKNAAIIKS